MEKLKQLIKESFDLFVKKRWLKEIDSAVTRYEKARTKADYELYVVDVLLEKYEGKYGEDLRGGKYGRTNS